MIRLLAWAVCRLLHNGVETVATTEDNGRFVTTRTRRACLDCGRPL